MTPVWVAYRLQLRAADSEMVSDKMSTEFRQQGKMRRVLCLCYVCALLFENYGLYIGLLLLV